MKLRIKHCDMKWRGCNTNYVRQINILRIITAPKNIQKLKEENAKLKEYFWTMLKERKGMRTSTLFAIVRARQYELEFEGIQQEWNYNGRMWNMLLTSWPEEETMYHDNWWTTDLPAQMANGSIDWERVTEADHHWNVEELHAYPDRMVGQKLWPNPHPMVSNETVCAYCQSPFGPEDAIKLDHVEDNSIHNVSSTM